MAYCHLISNCSMHSHVQRVNEEGREIMVSLETDRGSTAGTEERVNGDVIILHLSDEHTIQLK